MAIAPSAAAAAASERGEPAAESASASASASASETSAPAEAEAVPIVVEIVGLEEVSVREALALRLGERPLLQPTDARPDGPIAYAIVRREETTHLRLTLILAGGNAYDRDVDDVPGQSARAAAGALVTLLHAVETGTAVPTRVDVPIPEPAPAPKDAPKEAPREAPKEPEPAPPPPAPVAEPPPPIPIVELAPTITPLVGLGLAPIGPAPVLLGAGGSLGLDMRTRSGAATTIEVRMLGRSAAGLGLLRTRVAIGGGYVLRRGAFELPLLARVFVEPWWIRDDNSNAPILYGTGPAPRRPLLGGGIRVSPGIRIEPRRPGQPSIHVGARVDVDGSFVPHDGAHSIRIAVDDRDGSTQAARLGGLELTLGIDVTLWFPVFLRR